MLLATDHDCRKFLEVFSKGSSKGILDLCQGFLQIMRFFLSAAFNTSTKLTAALSFDSTSQGRRKGSGHSGHGRCTF